MLIPRESTFDSQRLAFPTAFVLMLTIGWVDFITGYRLSFFIFYSAPILLTVRYCSRNSATLIALMCAIVWWWADWKSGHPYVSDWGQMWETTVRLAFFLFVVVGGSAMKTKNDALLARLQSVGRQRQLEREIVVAAEREQQRIGRDLHDGLCQFLAGIGCAATSLKDDLRTKFQPEAEQAAEIEELLRDAVVQARDVARGLAPIHVDSAGLVAALDDMAANTSRLTNMPCEFETEGALDEVVRDVSTNLYRIAQEATSNAVKHSRAQSLRISFCRENEELILTIQDDGAGLPDEGDRTDGMGLRTMQYRARAIGAKLTITGLPGAGTTVQCRLPVTGAFLPDSADV